MASRIDKHTFKKPALLRPSAAARAALYVLLLPRHPILARQLGGIPARRVRVEDRRVTTMRLDVERVDTALDAANCSSTPIVVEASAPGLGTATISIPTSIDAATDGAMAVARATAVDFTYLDDFVG